MIGTFESALEEAGIVGANLCVCMGDLFETHTVSNDLVEEVAHIYSTTARTYPDTTYILLKGNHDWHRNHEQTSSFDILAEMLEPVDNIVVASKPQRLYMDDGTVYGLFPWMPPEPRSALEWAQYICYDEPDIRTVFGHWDSAWSEHNIIPEEVNLVRNTSLRIMSYAPCRGLLRLLGHWRVPQQEQRSTALAC